MVVKCPFRCAFALIAHLHKGLSGGARGRGSDCWRERRVGMGRMRVPVEEQMMGPLTSWQPRLLVVDDNRLLNVAKLAKESLEAVVRCRRWQAADEHLAVLRTDAL